MHSSLISRSGRKLPTKRLKSSMKDLKNRLPKKTAAKKTKVWRESSVSSDESDMQIVDRVFDAEDDIADFESTQETSYRKAKQLLADLQVEVASNVGFDENEEIASKLEKDALEGVSGVQKYIADRVRLDDWSLQYCRHRLSVIKAVLSNDGRYIVSCSKDDTVVKYDLEEGTKVAVLKYEKGNRNTHSGKVFALAISAEDRYLATGGSDMIIRIWNLSNLLHVKNLQGHLHEITGLAFRMGTQQLYSCSRDRSVRIWELEQMGYVDTLFGHVSAVVDIDVLFRERVLTCGSFDRSIRLWKIVNETHLVFNGAGLCSSVDCVAFINDDHFISGSADGSLCVWSILKKKPVCTYKFAHGLSKSNQPNWIISVSAVKYSDLVASGSCDGYIRFWKASIDYKSISNILSFALRGFINSLCFSENGDEVVCAVGQEHKYGRWWKIGGAKNIIALVPLKYS